MHIIIAIIFFSFLSWLLSENKKEIKWKIIGQCFIWQILLAILLIATALFSQFFIYVSKFFACLNEVSIKATKFVFGGLANPPVESGLEFIFAFQALPILIVVSALSALLFHLRIMPIFVRFFALFFQKILNIKETLAAAISTNIFTGMGETAVLFKPYLTKLSRSELFSLMVCGVSCASAGILAIYDLMLASVVDNAMSHIISAIIMSVPASLAIAKIIVPEDNAYRESEEIEFTEAINIFDAITTGIYSGAKVAITIAAMLIGFLALIELGNAILSLLPETLNGINSIEKIFGLLFSPIAWIIGVGSQDIFKAGLLLGMKISFNELIAFNELTKIASELDKKTIHMMLYALPSFSNFSSIGIIIALYGTLVPVRKREIMQLCLKAILASSFVNCINASIAGELFKIVL